MTIIFSRSSSQLLQKQEIPADAIEVSLESAKTIQSALVHGLPFELLADGSVTIAPTTRHTYYADKKRWIAFTFKYSPSAGSFYPVEMLDDYKDLPNDLIDVTDEVHQLVVTAKSEGLAFAVDKGGESVKVASSQLEKWDAKRGSFVIDTGKQALHDAQVKAAEEVKAAEARAQAKEQELATITVTTQSGKTFDGDELAQNRMSRAIQLSEIIGQKTIEWKLADNTLAEVSVDELKEAMLLAMKRTAEIVARY